MVTVSVVLLLSSDYNECGRKTSRIPKLPPYHPLNVKEFINKGLCTCVCAFCAQLCHSMFLIILLSSVQQTSIYILVYTQCVSACF